MPESGTVTMGSISSLDGPQVQAQQVGLFYSNEIKFAEGLRAFVNKKITFAQKHSSITQMLDSETCFRLGSN